MTTDTAPTPTDHPIEYAGAAPLRSLLGGALMGLANLVPGVSGGTMLLAAGVYPRFIEAVAEVTKFRFKKAYLITLACVVGAAVVAIVALAGPTKDLVVNHRWVMYSLFIGLTLGGVPIVWKLAKPVGPAVFVGALVGLLLMVAMAVFAPQGGGGESNWLMFVIAGVAGAGAMILPGVSGGYLLLLLGQYVAILGAIENFKDALTAEGGFEFGAVFDAGMALVPIAIGVGLGVLVISNLVEWALAKHEKSTLGLLLGLLLGAVVGLWPFQQSVEPVIGDVIKGQEVTAATVITEIDREDWPLERFAPSGAQVAGSLGLIVAGFGATMLIGRIGSDRKRT